MCLNQVDHVFKRSLLTIYCKISYKNEVDHVFKPDLVLAFVSAFVIAVIALVA